MPGSRTPDCHTSASWIHGGLLATTLGLPGCVAPQLEMLTRFEAALAAQDSATAALAQWCTEQGIAATPVITADLVRGADAPPPPDLRTMLEVNSAEPLAYRHVRLSCGSTVLSEAHNWYVPGRLTTEMNTALAGSDTPFGKVVAPLHFRREPLATEPGRIPPCPHGTISTHRALLRLPDSRPISLVMECYTQANLPR
jgi:chorismate-pyruvate lyase